MDTGEAIAALSALAHPGRLEVFRLLVRAGKDGISAGEIARAVGQLPQTLSGNVGILSNAGLVTARREGRSILYMANYSHMSGLLGFLMEDCCAGNEEIVRPLADRFNRTSCCGTSDVVARAQP